MLSPVTLIVRQMLRSHLNGACIDDPVVNPPARRRSWSLTGALRTRASGRRRRERARGPAATRLTGGSKSWRPTP
jgi:hypothetical protein